MIHVGDCLLVMPTLEASSVDAIVTDPPYGLGFMGKDWDHGIPGEHFWREALRVAKPGAHLVAFGGTRTFHRLVCAIEDAGWEIRDCLMWVYGSGFPKSLDVSKAIDKAAGAEREVISERPAFGIGGKGCINGHAEGAVHRVTVAASDEARAWEGWGTALKPAWEPIILARKPLTGTVAANVLRHGTGALNIDGCRVGIEGGTTRGQNGSNAGKARNTLHGGNFGIEKLDSGRWPANVIHDGSDEVVAMFPQSDGQAGAVRGTEPSKTGDANCYGEFGRVPFSARGDTGSAARFFYTAKADREDRNWGCDRFEDRPLNWSSGDKNPGSFQSEGTKREARNHHPTVKPHDLMRWLCRLVTPPGGLILDPFCGSGSTGRAAMAEGMRFVGIELDPHYAEIAEARMQATQPGLAL